LERKKLKRKLRQFAVLGCEFSVKDS